MCVFSQPGQSQKLWNFNGCFLVSYLWEMQVSSALKRTANIQYRPCEVLRIFHNSGFMRGEERKDCHSHNMRFSSSLPWVFMEKGDISLFLHKATFMSTWCLLLLKVPMDIHKNKNYMFLHYSRSRLLII